MGLFMIIMLSLLYWGVLFMLSEHLSSFAYDAIEKKMEREATIYRWGIAIISYVVFLLAIIFRLHEIGF